MSGGAGQTSGISGQNVLPSWVPVLLLLSLPQPAVQSSGPTNAFPDVFGAGPTLMIVSIL